MSDLKMRAYIRMLIYEVLQEVFEGVSVGECEQNSDGDEFCFARIDADKIAENLWSLRQNLDGAPLRFSEVTDQREAERR